MDIAALSINLNLNQVQQTAKLAMMKKTMDMQETTAANLINIMQTSTVQPSFGHKLDVRA